MHRRLALLVLLASTACWVGTPAAGARPLRPGPWAGEYLVTLTHTHQRSSWNYSHTASDPCDASGRGSGFEDSRLTGGSARLTATGATPPGEYGAPASSLQVEFGIAPDIPGSGTVDRDGTLTFDQPSGACGSGDGGGHAPARDCGIKGAKNTYELQPDGLRQLSWRGTQLGSGSQLFQNCPFMAPYEFPRVMPVDVPFHPAQFGPGMPVVDLAGHTVEPFSYADTTATTTGDVQLRIIPVAVVPAVIFASRAKTLDVDRHGNFDVPVACSAAGSCAGTLGAGFNDVISPAAAAVAAAGKAPALRFPAPVRGKPGMIDRTSFRLKAKGHRRLRLTIPPQTLRYLKDLPLTLMATERARRSSVSFAIARFKLRPRR